MRLALCSIPLFLFACVNASSRPAGDSSDTHEADSAALEDGVDAPDPDTGAPDVIEPTDSVSDDAADTIDTTITPGDTADSGVTPVDTTDATITPTDTADASDDPDGDAAVRLPGCLPAGCTATGPGCEVLPGSCFIAGQCVPDGVSNYDDDCQVCDAKKAPLVWSKAAEGTSCDDGVSCTDDDVCAGGVCQGEDACTGSTACSTQQCNLAADQCEAEIDPGRCLIDGQCLSEGQAKGDHCAACRPDQSATSWTAGDINEPDDLLDFANGLDPVERTVTTGTEQDPGWYGPRVDSSLSPSTDVDSFGFVYPTNASFTRPTVRVSRAGTDPIEACVYIRCLPVDESRVGRPTAMVACSGSDTKDTVGEWVGCCHTFDTPAFHFTPSQAWCDDAGQKLQNFAEAGVTLRRKPPSPEPACLPYVLRWGMR